MMTSSKFQFDASQQYQLDAIASVVDLFDGQPKDTEKLLTRLRGKIGISVDEASEFLGLGEEARLAAERAAEVGAIGNTLVIDRDLVLANLQRVQDRNGLRVSDTLAEGDLDFDINMETGTGKTYVYLRTIFELAAHYNFTKFVILVPSVAIREGVNTSIRLMRRHFEDLYKPQGITFDSSVYSGKNPDEVRPFATATNVQIMVMTIDSIRGTANSRVFLRDRNQLNGLTPRDFIQATHPVVIMDEPQNMKTAAAAEAIRDLSPAFTLRYSATHATKRNIVYSLDPVDAHNLGLVKQIVVAEVQQHGADASPYIRLVEVRRDPWVARVELACRKADGSLERRVVSVKQNQEFSDDRLTSNPVYEGWRINEMSLDPPYVDLTKHGFLHQGETIGASTGAIYKEMIRETVREHLRKEAMLRARGIKVLSLFFVDKVGRFLGEGANNEDANGEFVQWFDEVFLEERARSPRYLELLPQEPSELRRAYFSEIRRGGRKTMQDSSGTTRADDDAYELIMQHKARLLDQDEPVRFIFSHSALREGWDNPNVFQICTLREIGGETERRQTIGRGLRLPVARTDEGFVRVAEPGIATLTVIANESYTKFADALQKEYRDAGVEIGLVRKSEFSRVPLPGPDGQLTDEQLGYHRSLRVWEHLESHGFIDSTGKVTPKFQPNQLGFDLFLPPEFSPVEQEIIEQIGKISIGRYVKPASKREARRLNKEVYDSPEFIEFWDKISQRTTYRVTVDRETLIEESVRAIRIAPKVDPLRVQVTRAGVKMLRGGALSSEKSTRSTDLKGSYDLPDILAELQEETSLTRATIIDILIESGRLEEFINNPNDYLAMVKRILKTELAKIVAEGIQYEKIAGSVYELRELQEDGLAEKDRFIDQMYRVQNTQKTDFDYVVFDSEVERQFAELLDSREDIRLFMKLPPKFRIDTPVGHYNPDWAIIKQEEGQDKIYLIRETKSTLEDSKLRPTELAKIRSAERHFEAIGVVDYARAAPGQWGI